MSVANQLLQLGEVLSIALTMGGVGYKGLSHLAILGVNIENLNTTVSDHTNELSEVNRQFGMIDGRLDTIEHKVDQLVTNLGGDE